MVGLLEAVLINRKVQLRYCSVRKDDGVSQLAQLLHESARSSGWVSEADVVVGAEVDIVDLVMHDVPAGLENRVADGHQRAFRASSWRCGGSAHSGRCLGCGLLLLPRYPVRREARGCLVGFGR